MDEDAIEIELAVEEKEDDTSLPPTIIQQTTSDNNNGIGNGGTTGTRQAIHNRVLSDLLHHFNENDLNSEEFRQKFGISGTRITKFSQNQTFLFPERSRGVFDDDSEEDDEEDDYYSSEDDSETLDKSTPSSTDSKSISSTVSSSTDQQHRDNLTMVVIHKPFELISKDSQNSNGANGFIKIMQDTKLRLSSIEPNTALRLKKKVKDYTRSDRLKLYHYHYNAKCYADRFMYCAEQSISSIQTPSNKIVRQLLRPMENRQVRVISQYVYDKRNVENYKSQALKWITGLPDHPNVVKHLDFEVDYVMNPTYNEKHYVFWIILENLLEPMMTKFIEQSKGSGGACLEYKFLLDWMIQLASALEHLHKHEILHGNLQIDSVFVTNNQINQIKLGNMQLMPCFEETPEDGQSTDEEEQSIPYTRINRPPLPDAKYPGEGDLIYDKRAEVFCFGVLLLAICTLRKNVAQLVNAFWSRDSVYIRQIYNQVSKLYTKQLEGVLMRCCDYNPEKRPTISELVEDLKRIQLLYISSRSRSKSKSSTSYIDKIRQDQFESEYGSFDLFETNTSTSNSDLQTPRANTRSLALPVPLLAADGPAYISTLLACGKLVRKHVDEKYKKKRNFSIAGIKLMKQEGNKSFFKVRIVNNKQSSPLVTSPVIDSENSMFHRRPETHRERTNSGMNLGMKSTREQELLRLKGSIQDYEVDDLINAGSQGRVYLAREKKTEKYVAIKRIELKNDDDIQIASKEVSVMYDVSEQHPGFIKIHNWFLSTEPSTIYSGMGDRETWYMNIVLEYASGGDLRSRITEHKRKKTHFKVSTVCAWLRQICSALKIIHQRKLMHRDLKPSNIFLTPNDNSHMKEPNRNHSPKQRLDDLKGINVDLLDARIGDLGLAIRTDELTRMNNRQGTEIYKSPEAHANKKYNTSSDIWSLGCLAMEIITLEELVDYHHKLEQDPDYVSHKLGSLANIVDERLTSFCLKCLQTDPLKRPTAEELDTMLKGDEEISMLPLTDTDDSSSFEDNEKDLIEVVPVEEAVTLTVNSAPPKTPRTPRNLPIPSSPRDKRRVTLTEFNDFIISHSPSSSLDLPKLGTLEAAHKESKADQFPTLEPKHKEKLHQLLMKKVDLWSEAEVGIWLTTIGFSRYVELFKTQEIDGQALLYLPQEELEKIGVSKIGPRVKLWDSIVRLRDINKAL